MRLYRAMIILLICGVLFTQTNWPIHSGAATPPATEASAHPEVQAMIEGCPVFPPDNAWNRDVSQDAVNSNSAAYIASINRSGKTFLHADFGSDPEYGIPYVVV